MMEALKRQLTCGRGSYRKSFSPWAIRFAVAGVSLQVIAAWVDFRALDGTIADWFSALSIYFAGAIPTLIYLADEDGKELCKEREREEKREVIKGLRFHVGTVARGGEPGPGASVAARFAHARARECVCVRAQRASRPPPLWTTS